MSLKLKKEEEVEMQMNNVMQAYARHSSTLHNNKSEQIREGKIMKKLY